MSIRLRAGRPARILRSLSAVAFAAGAAAALPSAAHAAASDLSIVATKTAVSHPQTPAVLTLTLKNAGASAFDPRGTDIEGAPQVSWSMPNEWPRYSASVRSAHGWDCVELNARRGFCTLDHAIPASSSSLPVELEILPDLNEVPDTYEADVKIEGSVLQIPAGGGKPALVEFPVTGDRDGDPDGLIPFSFDEDKGLKDHPRAPQVTGSVDKPELTGTEKAVVEFKFSSAGTISTGPFNWKVDPWSGGSSVGTRSFNGEPSEYPNVRIGITLPADKVVLDDIQFFGLLDESVEEPTVLPASVGIAATPSTTPGFGEQTIEPSHIEKNAPTGEYLITLPSGVRLLTQQPVRVVATLHLQPGVNAADLVGEVSAPAEPIMPTTTAIGRALLGGLTPPAATTTVSVKRAAPPVVVDDPKPTTPAPTTPEPTTPVVQIQAPQSQPTTVPDQGAVLAARAAPKLTGRARFAKPKIYVGRQTNLTLTVDNVGNADSGTGLVCTKLSRHIVVVKLPKGVTVQGSKLCAKRSVLKPSGSLLAAKGIVVRGVVATPKATAIDGVNDGVALVGDRLQVVSVPSRGGGVTG